MKFFEGESGNDVLEKKKMNNWCVVSHACTCGPRLGIPSLSVCMCLLQHGLTLSRVRTTDTCKKPRVIKQLSISKEKKCRVSGKNYHTTVPTNIVKTNHLANAKEHY